MRLRVKLFKIWRIRDENLKNETFNDLYTQIDDIKVQDDR